MERLFKICINYDKCQLLTDIHLNVNEEPIQLFFIKVTEPSPHVICMCTAITIDEKYIVVENVIQNI